MTKFENDTLIKLLEMKIEELKELEKSEKFNPIGIQKTASDCQKLILDIGYINANK